MASQELRRRLRNALRENVYMQELLGLLEGTTGETYYVSSTSSTASASNTGKAPDEALTTIDAAINKCVANQGDRIIVMPGHAESVEAASGITCDVAGIEIIGLGRGSSRPTITFDTSTAATIVMSAANVVWRNFRFVNTQDALVVAFPVTAAYCGFESCTFEDDGTDNTIHWVTLSAAADYFECIVCLNIGTDTAGNTGFITIGAATGVKIVGLVSNGDFAAANIDMSAAVVDVLIEGCRLENANAVDVCIEGFAASTGWLVENYLSIATDAQTTAINTGGALRLYRNFLTNDDAEEGLLAGTASA